MFLKISVLSYSISIFVVAFIKPHEEIKTSFKEKWLKLYSPINCVPKCFAFYTKEFASFLMK